MLRIDEQKHDQTLCIHVLEYVYERQRVVTHSIKESATLFKYDLGITQHSTKSAAIAVVWLGNRTWGGVLPNLEISVPKTFPAQLGH